MAEALYYILNIVWAWELNRNKDCMHVSQITASQPDCASSVMY